MNPKQFKYSLWFFIGALFFIMILNASIEQMNQTQETVSFSEFKQKIAAGEMIKVIMIS